MLNTARNIYYVQIRQAEFVINIEISKKLLTIVGHNDIMYMLINEQIKDIFWIMFTISAHSPDIVNQEKRVNVFTGAHL